MRDIDDRMPEAIADLKELYSETGKAYIIGLTGNPGAGKSTVADALISSYRAGGLSVTLLSGDASGPVAALAAAAGIEDWRAGATPQEKVAELEAMAEEGERVLMVGDGLNDAAALAAAQVSMSPASAVDASRSASDVILLGDRIDHVVDAWDLAKTAHRRVMQNFVLAFAYNSVTVPLAFAGFVSPLIAAVSMSASSIVVALNAMRLGRAA